MCIRDRLLFLEAEATDKDINLYINSPGGSVTAGMAIYDTMKYIKCDVATVCIGMAASMGAFLLAGGAKGKRFALPNAEIMIHQPLGGNQGPVSYTHLIPDMKTFRRLLSVMNASGRVRRQVFKESDFYYIRKLYFP